MPNTAMSSGAQSPPYAVVISTAMPPPLWTALGDNTPFTVTSDVRQGTRSFSSFSAATAEIADARVFGGIHYRNSCVQGNAVGRAVADYVLSHAMRSPNEH